MWENGDRVLGKGSKWLVVLFLLFVVTWVNAAPTASSHGSSFVTRGVSLCSDTHIGFASETSQVAQYSNSQLADIGAELTKPPALFAGSEASSLPTNVKSLPPLPAAFFMTLTGFLCVSLVKDRRVWLAAVVGLLYIGQAGIDAVPRLVPHICGRQQVKQSLSSKATYVCELENFSRPRCDIEGTRFIGLLHCLEGIPDDKRVVSNQWGRVGALSRAAKLLLSRDCRCASAGERSPFAFTSAIIQRRHNLELSLNCLALRTRQPVCFSPAFIFERLPHGPPWQT